MFMNKLDQRRKCYGKISTKLACLSDEHLLALLAKAKPMHEGIGGASALMTVEGAQIFIKKIPLTDIELLPSNIRSTANVFELPLYYQYGVGSAGFGAWRELAIHIMTTNWVITGECDNFPILYHWRILPNDGNDLNINYWGDIEKYSQYWENSIAIRKRVEAINQASSHITLFLEYVPQNLHEWLQAQIRGNTAESAIQFVEQELTNTNTFMNSHGLMHFDAHFANILTDGELLYFSDFGLALSSQFELTQSESDFLKVHHNYDKSCAAVNFLHCIITTLFGKEQWEAQLRQCVENKPNKLSPSINSIIKKYGPTALVMDEFFQKLQKESKLTPYPTERIEKLLKEV